MCHFRKLENNEGIQKTENEPQREREMERQQPWNHTHVKATSTYAYICIWCIVGKILHENKGKDQRDRGNSYQSQYDVSMKLLDTSITR